MSTRVYARFNGCRLCRTFSYNASIRQSPQTTALRLSGSSEASIPFINVFRYSTQRSLASRRRKRKSLAHKETPTTKDRMRRLLEKNEMESNLLPTRKEAENLLSLARGRVTWVRNKIYEFWDPYYQKEGGRPVKQDLNMDARWWFWNILFAMLPAFTIAMYCEFRGQRLMHEYYQNLEIEKMRQVMGDEFVEENADKLFLPPPDNFVVRAYKFAQEVSSIVTDLVSPPPAIEREPDETPESSKPPRTTQPAPALTISKKDSQAATPTVKSTDATIDGATNIPKETTEAKASKEDLAFRIEHIEQILERQDREHERLMNYQLQRLNQSGVQNRVEDQMIDSWKERMTSDTSQHVPAAPVTDSNQGSSWPSLREVKELAEQAVRKTVDRVKPPLGDGDKKGNDSKRPITAPVSDQTVEKPAEEAGKQERPDSSPSESSSEPDKNEESVGAGDAARKGVRKWWPW